MEKFHHHTQLVTERSLTSRPILTSDEKSRKVIIEKTILDASTEVYSVKSSLRLEREAVAEVMADLSGWHRHDKLHWQEVRDGLNDISYPSKRISKLFRTAEKLTYLNNLRGSARELSDILSQNQDYRVQRVNIPTFTYDSSFRYVADTLLTQVNPRRLVDDLKSVGLDYSTARKLTSLDLQSSASVSQLAQITGFSYEELDAIEIGALLDSVDQSFVFDLLERWQYEQFVGFSERAKLNDDKLWSGGSGDLTVFIRDKDIPQNLVVSETEVSVKMGRTLRDLDRRTGLERSEVLFLSQAPRIVAQPKIVWVKQGNKRSFMYPQSRYGEIDGNIVARQSSLAGAAIAALSLGKEELGIGYGLELRRTLLPDQNHGYRKYDSKSYASLPVAGLGPLVFGHRQDDILQNDYFGSIENALQ